MLRTSIIKRARAVAAPRYFSASALRMAEGATGSGTSRPTGSAGGSVHHTIINCVLCGGFNWIHQNKQKLTTYSDAFTKRESAAEELYVRQEEKAKYG